MKTKVFALNEKGKIELAQEELQQLLDEAYYEGIRDGGHQQSNKEDPPKEPPVLTSPWGFDPYNSTPSAFPTNIPVTYTYTTCSNDENTSAVFTIPSRKNITECINSSQGELK